MSNTQLNKLCKMLNEQDTEQAIAVTLGQGTCHMEKLERWDGTDPSYRCDACGYENYEFEQPCYCPNCGREVER